MKLNPGITSPLFIILFSLTPLYSQISGIVNQYAEVLSIDYAANSVEVLNPSAFAINDRVLLIQMQGATIDENNNANFGTITTANHTGIYELATVCGLVGNDILFSYEILQNFNPASASNASIQLVKVYSGTDETVTATLTPAGWNGVTGGVLALELSGTLTLNADIDASGKGFRGAQAFTTNYTCNFATTNNDFFYDFNAGEPLGAEKGEGIARFINNKEYGKGTQANGGGGGNDHNSGGGGGANYGAGGQGGTRGNVGFFGCRGNHPGLGGRALAGFGYSPVNPCIYMGGGGGAGEDNNGDSDDAGNGGGIVLIVANQIEGNGFSIRANGTDALLAGGDGAGGGGAGGTILISSNTYGTTPLNLEAQGGNGGNTSINCEGPGGGGGGGVIWVASALTAGVTSNVNGGNNGTATGCSSNNGATPGGTGVVQTGLNIPEETVNISSCVLDVQALLWGKVLSNDDIELSWALQADIHPQHISLEHKNPQGIFIPLLEIVDNMQSWVYPNPNGGIHEFRLKTISKEGMIQYSHVLRIEINKEEELLLTLHPNPLSAPKILELDFRLPQSLPCKFSIVNLQGQALMTQNMEGKKGLNNLQVNLQTLPAGAYFCTLQVLGQRITQKILITN